MRGDASKSRDQSIPGVHSRNVAHRLVVELLAHQFAFPVRWIETQDEIFSRENAISRYVEVGPAKILGGMGKKTVDAKYTLGDMSRNIERRFLSSNQDVKDIYFDYETTSPQPAGIKDVEALHQSQPVPALNGAPPSTQNLTPPTATQIAVASISDVPTPAIEIIQSLVAHKLRKRFEEISVNKSLKELSGGKSTLQNELLGDLGLEFGHVPDSAEDLPLSALGDTIEPSFSGQLGKQSSSIVARFIGSKMPAGFNHNAIREYLEHTWGLGPSRQSAVLLFAITTEPTSRIASIDAAKEYFDALASRYSAHCGITLLNASSSGASSQQASTVMFDSTQLDAIRKDHHDLLSQQFMALAKHLQINPSNSAHVMELENIQRDIQQKLDLWYAEFGEEFELGIKPLFDARKARRYSSYWNLVRQDIMSLYNEAKDGQFSEDNAAIEKAFLHIRNRSHGLHDSGSTLELIKSLMDVSSNCHSVKGGFSLFGSRLVEYITREPIIPVFKYLSPVMGPQTTINSSGSIEYIEVPRLVRGQPSSYVELLARGRVSQGGDGRIPHIHIKRREGSEWKFDPLMTQDLLRTISIGIESGFSFAGKDVLVTGAGPGSIGAEVVRGLLMGGARVIVTTSRTPSTTAKFYQSLYNEAGARGSELLVLPFNQGSMQDCDTLIDHIYSKSGLGRDLDAVVPFAAISVMGTQIDELGGKAELAHRLMMINVLRILGRIVKNKNHQRINTRPTQVLLPLSPNHGTFGSDGFYSESKLGLEGLLNRFYSESWSEYLTVCGAVIGWTRCTGLMSGNDIVAQSIESKGVMTFSQKEMAFNLLTLLTEPFVEICENEPVWADLNGSLDQLSDLNTLISKARSNLNVKSQIKRAILKEDEQEELVLNSNHKLAPVQPQISKARRSTLRIGFPTLPEFDKDLFPLNQLQGMVDPSSTIVIVGFSELGPWGSARTRWEMEHLGTFTQEGYIEIAWIMNLICYFDGERNGEHYAGWIDVKTGAFVQDNEVAERYGRYISEHCGIRLIEPELFNGYDPSKKEYLHEVSIEEDIPEFDSTLATAEAFKLRLGDKVNIRQVGNSDEYRVQIKKGAQIMVPKAIPFDSCVAGQLPTGFDASRYGVPVDLTYQLDPVTLFSLCCASEALYSAGIIDSLEIFKYIHISELGNFIGSCIGGATKIGQMYKDQYLDKQIQGDIIQETFMCVSGAWMNMLLLGASGPIKTPNGTCATGVESLDTACESILAGKTKMCFVGGFDDFQEDESYGFAKMKATVNTKDEFAKGRLPSEMSRPTTESRAGFVESHGCGIQIVTTAENALEMGLPIYGVVASSTMAADKISRSVPAPGQGVLSFARESPQAAISPLLNIDYRREQMESSIASIRQWQSASLQTLLNTGTGVCTPSSTDSEESRDSSTLQSTINAAAHSRIKAIQRLWGNDFRRQDPEISPLKASLAVWGLSVDDLDIVSLHATSTKANDKNEPEVVNKQMSHLGRTRGRPLLAICQKSLTGHPKGPASAWMLNGCLQAMDSGIVPGNQNADNVDEVLAKFEHLVFPTRTIHTREIKAFLVNSFGFGQKGGQVVGVHPKYFFATLKKDAFEQYVTKVTQRKRLANRAYIQAVLTNSVFKAKAHPPYHAHDETAVLMDPLSRISESKFGDLQFDGSNLHAGIHDHIPKSTSPYNISHISSEALEIANISKSWVEQIASQDSESSVTVGIDVEEVEQFNLDNLTFINRNFTEAEQVFASASPDPKSTYAGRWSAKEAVFKSLNVRSQGAGAPMRDIEILSDNGIPVVKLYGEALSVAQENGIRDFKLSLTHSDKTAMALVLALHGKGDRSY
ncbi:hypothetical protein B7494_g7012 [Chlorociboria aeruginascens]|nr:hypothetical protein B7494_g7012 [Chlorociboria aeruginascens]